MKQDKASASKSHRLWVLFLNMLSISAFTFGGGFVIVTLMKNRFVDKLHWIDDDEMLDMIALSQSAPGAIAVNAGILVGWKTLGFAGMLIAVLGTILPPLIILSIVSVLYNVFIQNAVVATVFKGMQAGVAAVIADVVLSLGQKVTAEKDSFQMLLMAVAFIAGFFFNVNVMLIVLGASALGAARCLVGRKGRMI